MTVSSHAIATATYHDVISDIGTGTDRRDVAKCSIFGRIKKPHF